MLEAATTLATIVQLLALFIQERQGRTDANKAGFMEWLETHRHEEIKNLISETHHLSSQVDSLLREDHVRILSELEAIGGCVAEVMSQLKILSGISGAVVPEILLSEEAVSVIQHFEKSGESQMSTLPDGTGVAFGGNYSLKYADPRFVRDDLKTLQRLGFIREHMSLQKFNYTTYDLTRRGAEYARLSCDK